MYRLATTRSSLKRQVAIASVTGAGIAVPALVRHGRRNQQNKDKQEKQRKASYAPPPTVVVVVMAVKVAMRRFDHFAVFALVPGITTSMRLTIVAMPDAGFLVTILSESQYPSRHLFETNSVLLAQRQPTSLSKIFVYILSKRSHAAVGSCDMMHKTPVNHARPQLALTHCSNSLSSRRRVGLDWRYGLLSVCNWTTRDGIFFSVLKKRNEMQPMAKTF